VKEKEGKYTHKVKLEIKKAFSNVKNKIDKNIKNLLEEITIILIILFVIV
jgi:hypothetical protein